MEQPISICATSPSSDEKAEMKFRFTLQRRLFLWFTLLFVVLTGAILFVIEKKEVATIYEESTNKAVLIARHTADRNLQSILTWDMDRLQRDADRRRADAPLYVVFYDRYATPLVTSSLIAGRPDLFQGSLLRERVDPEGFIAKSRDIVLFGRRLRILEVEVPIFAEGSPDKWGSVKIGLSLEEMRAAVLRTRRTLILIGLTGLFLGLAGTTLLARRIVHPLRRLVEGTVRISRGEFGHRIRHRPGDEIGDLAASFNEMTEKLLASRRETEEAQRLLVQSEKLAQIGRLAASIAHEIRNPLTSVKLNIQKVLEDDAFPEADREHLALSGEGIAQIEKFIKEMLNFTRATELQKAPFPVEQIVDESLKMMADLLRERNIVIEKRLAGGLPEIVVDGDRLRQVLLNLLRNAAEAVGPGGRIVLSAEGAGGRRGRKLRICISDNGRGIPEKDWENIFEPFFTTKSLGIGLGLSNARKLVELHRGTIRVIRGDQPGTTFEIILPIGRES